MKNRIFKSNLKKFINEVMCRRESNQRKAHILWDRIKPHLLEDDIKEFELEWKGHYINTGELNPHDMSYYVELYLNPYLEN